MPFSRKDHGEQPEEPGARRRRDEDDVEGHASLVRDALTGNVADSDDVEGHIGVERPRGNGFDDADDTEGHSRLRFEQEGEPSATLEDAEDDTGGHSARVKL